MKPAAPLLPGATIGMLGSGQLGRMSGMAARRLGYRLVVHSPTEDSPAGQIADASVIGQLDDRDAILRVAQQVDVITYEFENVAVEPVMAAAAIRPVFPSPDILRVAQHRRLEKEAIQRAGVPVAKYYPIRSLADLEARLPEFPDGAVLKTATGGYDGKGQRVLDPFERPNLPTIYAELAGDGNRELILEQRIPFEREISVMVGRNAAGDVITFPVAENIHRDGILHLSIVPARVAPEIAAQASEIARTIAEALDLIGVLGVEMFQTATGLYVNEIAPRPHNSGHYTLDACVSSQFEQHIRAVVGLPFGSTELLTPVVMLNLLGEHMAPLEKHFYDILSDPNLKLHLYGKQEARVGRKMGHINAVADSVDEALQRLEPVWKLIRPDGRPLID